MALTARIRGGKAPLGNGKAEFDWPCDGYDEHGAE